MRWPQDYSPAGRHLGRSTGPGQTPGRKLARQSSHAALSTTVTDVSTTVTDALSCDASGRRMQSVDDAGAPGDSHPPTTGGAEKPFPSAHELAADFIAQNPLLAEKMDPDQLLRHLMNEFVQHFGQPARA